MPTREHMPQPGSDKLNIPDIFVPLLKEKVTIREVEAGQPIGSLGESDNRILCLLSGKAQVMEAFRVAQEVIVENLEPGDIFGDLAFLTGRRWPVDAGLVAGSPTRVLEISMDAFQRVLRENSDFAVALLKSLGKKTVRVDRTEFGASSRGKEGGPAGVCFYPPHPGLDTDLQKRFQSLAVSDLSILIIGENGVGKDILAYAIFDAADNHNEVLVPVNVRKLRAESFDSRTGSEAERSESKWTNDQMRILFGYEESNPEGDVKIFSGYLELARKGTLFIRGAHLLSAVTQQKLLDAWRTGSYCPPASRRIIETDFRLICTSEYDDSGFLPDRHPLLYELQQNALVVPPLRNRRDLIPTLAVHYLNHYAREMRKDVPELDDLTIKALKDYSWPGNDLELANVVRRAVVVSPGDTVRRQDLTFESQRKSGGVHYDLLRLSPIRQAVFSPLFPPILQSAFLPVFLGILLLLFFGPSDPSKNIAAVIMWALAWPGMILGTFLGARLSCSICAIGALSKTAKRILSLELPFPELLRLRSDFLIAVGILFIIWIECVTDMRNSPFNLGLLLLSMFLIAFVLNTLFARQTWCRYLCPLGGITGLFARTSILELRADSDICLSHCRTHECYYGTRKAEGCTFGQVVATLYSNQFCKICGNCVKNCPHGAVRLNLRIPGNELGEVRHVRTGTGFLVLSLNGALLADILTRVPWYDRMMSWAPGSPSVKFTFLYLVLILGVNILVLAAATLSHRAFRERLSENYSRFALSLLPLTCLGFLAFHVFYLFSLGPQMLDLLGRYLGMDGFLVKQPLVPQGFIRVVQEVSVAFGLLWTLITMFRLGRSSPRGAFRRRWGVLPHAITAVGLALALAGAMITAFPA
jgi:CRP-like cAMP-binding protein